MNYKIVQQVKRKEKKMTKALKRIMIVLGVFLLLLGIMISQGFLLPCFLTAGLYFIYEILSDKEYEYVLDEGILTITTILGKKYRKTSCVVDLKDLEVVVPNWHARVAKYKKDGGSEKLHKEDYTSYEDDIPYYTMIIKNQQKKVKILLDLEEEMLFAMKRMYPERVEFIQ